MSRRSNRNKARSPAPAPIAQESKRNWVVVACAAISTLLLISAFVMYRPTETIGDGDLEPKVAVVDPVDDVPQRPAELPVIETGIELPTKPMEFDTATVQDELVKAVELAAEKFPQDAQVLYVGALTFAELLQTDRAADLFKRSIAIDNTQPDVVVAYADILLQTGKQEEAVAVLQATLARVSPTVPLLVSLGDAYSQLGELEQAAETLQAGIEAFPDSDALYMRLAQAQNQLQQFAEAEFNARKAVELGRSDRATLLALSTALMRLDKREEAIEIRQRMPALDDERVTTDDQTYQESFRLFTSHTYSQLGLSYVANRVPSQGEALLLASLKLDPDSFKTLAALGDLFHKSGRLKDALAVYRRLIEVQPENLVNYSNCASLAISTGEVAVAEQVLLESTKRDASGYADLFFARFLIGLQQYERAASHAKVAIDRSSDIDAYVVLIAALQGQGKPADALNALLRAREIAPNDPRLANIRL